MDSVIGKNECPYSGGPHKHSNEIDICRICNVKSECKILCDKPKGNKIDRICLKCWELLHK